MADTAAPVEYDWSGVTASAAERLKAPKVVPVPAPIVALAQRSHDEKTVLGHTFKDDKQAEEFAKLIRHAGDHTKPQTSVQAVIDPENKGNKRHVTWKAGKRRGRSTA